MSNYDEFIQPNIKISIYSPQLPQIHHIRISELPEYLHNLISEYNLDPTKISLAQVHE